MISVDIRTRTEDESDMTSKPTVYHAHALGRGLTILERVASAPESALTIGELNTITGYPKSTLVRLIAVLEENGFLYRINDVPTFRIGHAVHHLAEGYRDTVDVAVLATPHLVQLAQATGQTANLGVIEQGAILHLCVKEPDRALRFRSASGSRDQIHSTGLGKILLAGLEESAARATLPAGRLERRTESTITSRSELMRDIERARQRGYAIDDGEGAVGVRCLAVPVTSDPSTETWAAAISVAGPAAELRSERPGPLLRQLRKTAGDMLDDGELMAGIDVHLERSIA